MMFCGAAGAAIVTVGPSLAGTWESEECGWEACTFVNSDLGGAGTDLYSPVDGAIVGWSAIGGSTAGTYRIRTVLQYAPLGFSFVKWSEPVASALTEGVQSFSTVLPIQRGMKIGLSMSETASLGFREGVGQLNQWEFEPPQSANSLEDSLFAELAGFNAEIQPSPTVASLGTTSGSTAGGTIVTITGTDFENTSGVSFGGAPAASFTVDSEGQLTAVAPANSAAEAVQVTVATIAGKATAPQTFNYFAPPVPPVVATPTPAPHCVVPTLNGKSLKASKTALAKALCELGSVRKLGDATVKLGRVASQGSKPGSQLAVGTKVAVTLKLAKPAAKKRHKH
jgi:hypothetical protein